VTIMTIVFFARWTCSLISMHAVLLFHGRERLGMPFTHCFPRKNAFPLFLMLPLSFKTNYDVLTVLRQSAHRAIILAKILSYALRSGFPHFLEAFPSSV